jgi:hypothetical protein
VVTPTFTHEEATALLPEARRRIAEVATMVADLQRRRLDAGGGAGGGARGDAGRGGGSATPELKALEAAIDEALSWFSQQGIQVKGVAPALLDFPAHATIDGERRPVLLCWREGEERIDHFHLPETGYLGRTPIALADEI